MADKPKASSPGSLTSVHNFADSPNEEEQEVEKQPIYPPALEPGVGGGDKEEEDEEEEEGGFKEEYEEEEEEDFDFDKEDKHDHQKPERDSNQESTKWKKRSREDGDSPDRSLPKRKREAITEKPMLPRKSNSPIIWSIEDEEAVLSGLADYWRKKGILPLSRIDMIPFFEFVQSSLKIKVTVSQLGDKLLRLKQKFEGYAARIRTNPDFTFRSTHERNCYELSKDLWERIDETQSESYEDQVTEKKFKSTRKRTGFLLNNNEDSKKPNLDISYLTESIHKIANEFSYGTAIKQTLKNLDTDKASALDEQVSKLKMKEKELLLQRIFNLKEVLELIHESISTTK